MNEHFSVKDESPEHVWYSQLPNILRFIKLTPYQKAIYWEMKAVAGDFGSCFKSIKSLAESCEMSERKVHETLKELCEINPILKIPLLKKTCRIRPDGGSASSEYTVTNIWIHNNKMYISIISSGGAQYAGGGMHVVQGEGAPGADKEEPIKKNQKEEDDDEAKLCKSHRQKGKATASPQTPPHHHHSQIKIKEDRSFFKILKLDYEALRKCYHDLSDRDFHDQLERCFNKVIFDGLNRSCYKRFIYNWMQNYLKGKQ